MTDNREAWLIDAVKHLSDLLEEDVPPVRVSVGWPGGRSRKGVTIGQCWPTAAAEDGVCQIFLSPIRGGDRTIDILGTLLHEIIHAVDDCKSGHRGNFARIAKGVGFVPKLTSSDNRSDELNEALSAIAERMGYFPHSAITTLTRAADQPKKQATRMLKLTAPCCGYTVRTTRKWLDEGRPSCPCGTEMEES